MRYANRLITVALCLQTSSLTAQQYKHTPGDTLRYREANKITVQTEVPDAATTMVIETSGLVLFAFLRGDSARVWYDSMKAKVDSPMGDLGGDVAQAFVGKSFMLRFLPNGTVLTVSAPSFDSGIGALAAQNAFYEWFPKLPTALTIGTVWQDSLKSDFSPMPGVTTKLSGIRRFRVTRDSMVSGVPVLVIETTGTIETSGGGNIGGTNMTVTIKSDVSGMTFYARDLGIIVGRTSKTTIEGITEMSGPMSMSVPTRTQMESRVELIRK